LIAALSFSSYLDPDFKFMAGLITVIFGLVAIAWDYQKNREDVKPMLKRVDWKTGFFLAGIFIMVESLTKTGVIDNIAKLISATIGNNLLFAYVVIVVGSLVFSAFIDNIPFIAAMLPVIQKVSLASGFNPIVLYFGMLIGTSVGGNITPVGASANIVAMGIAKKEGYHTKFWDFVKIGLPFSIVATAASAIFVYLAFG